MSVNEQTKINLRFLGTACRLFLFFSASKLRKKALTKYTPLPYPFYRRCESRSYLMKKTYKIEVDCANCANLMEEAAGKIQGVSGCTVNFMTLKMEVDFEEGADEKKVMREVLKACRKVEPDCEIEL